MKLDFETNLSHVSADGEEFYNDTSLENIRANDTAQFQAGVKAARDGNRIEARFLLLRVVEAEPDNENAWMELASVSEYPEELLGFLAHALRINPDNARAAEWTKSTRNLLSQKFVQRGSEALENARRNFAKQCFLQAIAHDDENETAWLQMASLSDSVEEKNAHLEKVLALNPENVNALVMSQSLKNQTVDQLLQKAVAASIAGEREAAKPLLDEILRKSPGLVDAWILKSFLVESFEEKIDCFERILDVDDENELANVNWTALLDIMAKAELKSQTAEAKQVSVSKESNDTESNVPFAAPETKENFDYNSFASDENVETTDSDFNAKAVEKEVYFNDEAEEKFEPSAEDKGNSDYAKSEFMPEKTELYEEPAEHFSVDSEIQTNLFQTVTQDFTPLTTGELSTPPEALPSYYKDGTDFSVTLEAAKSDYSTEFSEPKSNDFEENFLETPEASRAASDEFDERSFVEALSGEEDDDVQSNELSACPFCDAEEDAQALVCNSCHTMLTLSDLEMLLAHQDADQEILREAVERIEDERNRRDFDVEDLKLLAVGHINLRNLRQGCAYLTEAAQLNPNDVFLSSQVNSLKIRLAEIEEQQDVQDSMPRNRKILVVDDSATVRKLISGKLEKSGHEVFSAVDGVDALEKIKEFVPDLILLDINMPRMDGYQVCKLIRGNEETKDVPIVMISGKDGFFDKVRGRMAGTTGYITKPFGPETLMKMLDTYIV